MAKLHFKRVIKIHNGNPYVLVTADQAEQLQAGWRKPMPVFVQINGQPVPAWRINLMPIGDGRFYLYLHGDVRKASRAKVGDGVTVDVRFDNTYKNGPMHPMPVWFRTDLDGNPRARQAWDKLIPSRQKEVVRYFSWLKSDAAQQRNLAKMMKILDGHDDRFMARDWRDGQ